MIKKSAQKSASAHLDTSENTDESESQSRAKNASVGDGLVKATSPILVKPACLTEEKKKRRND